mgnify:CR=1 FL=1
MSRGKFGFWSSLPYFQSSRTPYFIFLICILPYFPLMLRTHVRWRFNGLNEATDHPAGVRKAMIIVRLMMVKRQFTRNFAQKQMPRHTSFTLMGSKLTFFTKKEKHILIIITNLCYFSDRCRFILDKNDFLGGRCRLV